MKQILLSMIFLLSQVIAFNQNLPKRAEQRAKDKVGNKVDESVDRGVDSAFNKTARGIESIFKKKEKKKGKSADMDAADEAATESGTGSNNRISNGKSAKPKSNSNTVSDFIPGQMLIFADSFVLDQLGDFPAKWNSNGSGKVVELEGLTGKWLEIQHNTIVNPVLDKSLPENATIEFDLFLKADGQLSTPFIQFGLTPARDIMKENIFYLNRFFFTINRYTEPDGKTIEYGLKDDVIGNKNDFDINALVNEVLHVSIAINKSRIRIYLNDTKLVDLPRALSAEMRNNLFFNNGQVIPASEIGMLISNIRIASADADARSLLIKQLMEDGETETSDILFDSNSDVIKSSSFPILKQFGDALNQYPDLKFKITGHTDSDGADAANLELSKRRAIAVKKYLVTNFSVNELRILTDGKGETEPAASNSTSDGKAKNRRVQFTRL